MNSKTIKKMDKEKLYILMMINMRDNGKMMLNMEKENICLKTAINIMEILKMVYYINILYVIFKFKIVGI